MPSWFISEPWWFWVLSLLVWGFTESKFCSRDLRRLIDFGAIIFAMMIMIQSAAFTNLFIQTRREYCLSRPWEVSCRGK